MSFISSFVRRLYRSCAVSAFALMAVSAFAREARIADAKPDVAAFFRLAPDEVASFIPEYGRLDMIDYYSHGMAVKTENMFGEKIALRELSTEKLVYQSDDSVTTEIDILPVSDSDTVVMAIRTVPMPMRDSELSFYDKSWKQLAKQPIALPELSDWLVDSSRRSREEAASALPFMLTTASYDPESRRLTITNRTADFFVPADRPAVLDNLRDRLTYEWRGRRFVLVGDD